MFMSLRMGLLRLNHTIMEALADLKNLRGPLLVVSFPWDDLARLVKVRVLYTDYVGRDQVKQRASRIGCIFHNPKWVLLFQET